MNAKIDSTSYGKEGFGIDHTCPSATFIIFALYLAQLAIENNVNFKKHSFNDHLRANALLTKFVIVSGNNDEVR